MKLVYINSGVNSVFDSQVLSLLNYYNRNEHFEEVILFFGYQSDGDIDWLKKKDISELSVYYFKLSPNYLFFNYKNQKSLYQSINKIDTDFSDYYFHIRSELTSYHFKKIKHKLNIKGHQLLTDVRGASIAEVKQFYRTNSLIKPFKLINYYLALKMLKIDNNISVVSSSLKDYLLKKIKIDNDRINVNPCLVNDNFVFDSKKRDKIRKELKLNRDELLLVFASGGTAKWQNNDMINRLATFGFKVLNLSKVNIEHKNIINRFVPYEEVPGYLSAADISFIWRDDSIVNNVASPVKVSEYVACGLPIIHNGTVMQIKALFNAKSESLMLENIDELNMKKAQDLVKLSNREELSLKGRSLFGLSVIAHSYEKYYSNL